jgi:hypothetical protein
MKEFIKSIFESSRERIKSPLIGAFILAWLVFNWKALFTILFAADSIDKKILTVESKYSELENNFWLPLVIALIYILALPYIMWLFDVILNKAQEGRKSALLKGQLFDIKSKQKIAFEEIELEKIKADRKEKEDLNQKIEILQGKVNVRNEKIEQFQEELKNNREIQIELKDALNKQNDQTLTKTEIESFQQKYSEFKESDLYRFFELLGTEVSRRGQIPSNTGDLVIEKFIHQGIVKELVNHELERTTYEFTKLGNYFWFQFLSSIRFVKKESVIVPEDDDLPF